MKTTLQLVVLCATVLLEASPLRAQAPSIFEPKGERLQGPPLWISAQEVADERKIIDLDRLDSPHLRKEVEQQKRELGVTAEKLLAGEKPAVAIIPSSECRSSQLSSGQSHRGGTASSSSLSDLASNSQSILRGAIRTVDAGFDGGVPASLLGVEVSAVVKGSAPRELLYVLYPVARFRIGPLYFCNARQGFEPRPGDEILLFDYTGPVDRDQILLAPRLDQIFFHRRDGALFLPFRLRSSPGLGTLRTLDEVVARLNLGKGPSSSRGAL